MDWGTGGASDLSIIASIKVYVHNWGPRQLESAQGPHKSKFGPAYPWFGYYTLCPRFFPRAAGTASNGSAPPPSRPPPPTPGSEGPHTCSQNLR